MLEFKLIYGLKGYEAAKEIREKVFCEEQGIPFDYDEYDNEAWHIVGYEKERLIAAARMYKVSEGVFKIGRVCVDRAFRKMYVADTLLRSLEDKAVCERGWLARVSSQEAAVGFYEKEGYVKKGDTYPEADIPHIMLEKDLTKPFKRCGCCEKK